MGTRRIDNEPAGAGNDEIIGTATEVIVRSELPICQDDSADPGLSIIPVGKSSKSQIVPSSGMYVRFRAGMKTIPAKIGPGV